MQIVIDIETRPGDNPPLPSEIKVPGNITKAESIEAYRNNPANIDKAWQAQALDPLVGKIVSIAIAIEDGDPISATSQDEDALLYFLDDEIAAADGKNLPVFIGFNHKAFDLQWIWLRAKKYNYRRLASLIPRERYSARIIDLIEVASGSYKFEGYSLDRLLKFFPDLPQKSGNGSEVFQMWREGRLDDIAAYNRQDVTVTRELYRRLCQ